MVFFIQWPKWVTWNTLVSTVISTPTKASRARAGMPQTTPFTALLTRATPSRKPPPSSAAAHPARRVPAAAAGRMILLCFICSPASPEGFKSKTSRTKVRRRSVSRRKVYNPRLFDVYCSGPLNTEKTITGFRPGWKGYQSPPRTPAAPAASPASSDTPEWPRTRRSRASGGRSSAGRWRSPGRGFPPR